MVEHGVNIATELFTTQPCIVCGETSEMVLERNKLHIWKNGTPVQIVFPEVNDDARELLISGTHPQCWGKIFGDNE